MSISRDNCDVSNPSPEVELEVIVWRAERVRENSVDGTRIANIQTIRKESTSVCKPNVLVEKGVYWLVNSS